MGLLDQKRVHRGLSKRVQNVVLGKKKRETNSAGNFTTQSL